MQIMRYINLLDKVSSVRTRKCFVYNNIIFFAVPQKFVSKAIGPDALNVKKIQSHLGKKVKIISEPEGLRDIKKFIDSIIAPNKFKSLEVKDGIVIITGGSNQNKASLIGRNRRRFDDLEKIVYGMFEMGLKVI